MTAPPVSERALRAFTDAGGYQRGAEYARIGMVTSIAWDAGRSSLNAVVRGSGRDSYRCRVVFGPDGALVSSSCDCPVREACKHVVAAVIVSNRSSRVAAAPGTSALGGAATSTPRWRSLIARAGQGAGSTPLALGIELRRRATTGRHQWSPKPAESAHPRDLVRDPGQVLLAVRPLLRSDATGNWIQGDATWDTIRRSPLRFAADQVRWFTDFLGIARDSMLSGTAGDWIVLDHVGSQLLWPLLDAASAVGIPLVATQKHTDLVRFDRADVTVRITGTDELEIGADVTIDGEHQDSARIRAIGKSGLYAWEVRGARVHLQLGPADISPIMMTLMGEGEDVVVPAAEREAFIREAYPALVRQGGLVLAEGLELPPVVAPVAVLDVRFGRGHRLEYALAWEYEGFGRFPVGAGSEPVRDPDAEREILEGIANVWSQHSALSFRVSGSLNDLDTAEFVAEVMPALEADGVRVEISGRSRSYRELTGVPEITVSTVETTQPDWFDLGVLVTIDGKTIPFQPLFTALAMRRTKLMLVDGSYFSLAHPALQRLRDLLDEAAELAEWETGPRISRHQIALWEEFEDLADQAQPAVAWRALAEGLRDVASVPETAQPAGIDAVLRPYQKAGFDWLAFLWSHRLGGILADDMGLGKTLQLLALVQHLAEIGEERPVLVVAPTSVLLTWQEEAARFAPGLRVTAIDATSVKRGDSVADAAAEADLIVTSYTLLRLDEEEFSAVEWAAVILDEAQFVKNPVTRVHRAVSALRTEVTIAVTGTPMENSLSELWALLQLTAPGLFPSARRFRQEYIQPIEQGKVPENEEGGEYRRRRLERLRRRIRPLMLRRTKELVAAELPAKQEQLLHVDLAPAHRAVYDAVLQRERQKVLGLLQDLDRNRFIVFRSLTLLRMLSLAPGLVDEADAGIASRKLEVLVERVEELRAEGHRALVFSQFTSFLDLAAQRLDRAGIPYAYLDGSTRRRSAVIEGFRSGEQPVFLISLKAGGFGLTLTEADYVFLLDPWWNPAAEAQAVDRTHRIGQDKQVFVYRMISTGTIEEKVLALQQRKARLFSAVMDDDELFARSLTAEDIRGLFEP
ncbi:DEAD/DEAH box helicase [Microbacterium sp. NPDC055903]